MPIMSANAQSDARGAAWLLASAALECIEKPANAIEARDALNNAYRLLDGFRRNVFFGQRPVARPNQVRDNTDMLSIAPSSERHLSEVRVAMEAALASSFGSDSTDEAIERITAVLRALARLRVCASACWLNNFAPVRAS